MHSVHTAHHRGRLLFPSSYDRSLLPASITSSRPAARFTTFSRDVSPHFGDNQMVVLDERKPDRTTPSPSPEFSRLSLRTIPSLPDRPRASLPRKRSVPPPVLRPQRGAASTPTHRPTKSLFSPLPAAYGYVCFPSRSKVPGRPDDVGPKRELPSDAETTQAFPTPPPSPPLPEGQLRASVSPPTSTSAPLRQLITVPPHIRQHLLRGGKVEMRSHDGKMSWMIGLPRSVSATA